MRLRVWSGLIVWRISRGVVEVEEKTGGRGRRLAGVVLRGKNDRA